MVFLSAVSEHNSLNFHARSVHKNHRKYLSELASPVIELSVGFLKHADHYFPPRNVNIQIWDFIKVSELILINSLFLYLHLLRFILKLLSSVLGFDHLNRLAFFSLLLFCFDSPLFELYLFFDANRTVTPWFLRLKGLEIQNLYTHLILVLVSCKLNNLNQILRLSLLSKRLAHLSNIESRLCHKDDGATGISSIKDSHFHCIFYHFGLGNLNNEFLWIATNLAFHGGDSIESKSVHL